MQELTHDCRFIDLSWKDWVYRDHIWRFISLWKVESTLLTFWNPTFHWREISQNMAPGTLTLISSSDFVQHCSCFVSNQCSWVFVSTQVLKIVILKTWRLYVESVVADFRTSGRRKIGVDRWRRDRELVETELRAAAISLHSRPHHQAQGTQTALPCSTSGKGYDYWFILFIIMLLVVIQVHYLLI